MRIAYQDLETFKAKAKHLHKLLPSLTLTAAKETLARVSGYTNYHEVRHSDLYNTGFASYDEIVQSLHRQLPQMPAVQAQRFAYHLLPCDAGYLSFEDISDQVDRVCTAQDSSILEGYYKLDQERRELLEVATRIALKEMETDWPAEFRKLDQVVVWLCVEASKRQFQHYRCAVEEMHACGRNGPETTAMLSALASIAEDREAERIHTRKCLLTLASWQ